MKTSEKILAKKIGQAIAKRRQVAMLTQDQVAEKLGIGYEAVSRIERGITIPTITRLFELADIFNCGIEELLLESSLRSNDQSQQIAHMLSDLNQGDREMILATINLLYARLK